METASKWIRFVGSELFYIVEKKSNIDSLTIVRFGWSSNLTKPLCLSPWWSPKWTEAMMIWYLYSKIQFKRMRHFNDNEITLTRDYKLVWQSRRSVSQQRGENRKGEEHTSPLCIYFNCLVSLYCQSWFELVKERIGSWFRLSKFFNLKQI